jgi:hypothetical protein
MPSKRVSETILFQIYVYQKLHNICMKVVSSSYIDIMLMNNDPWSMSFIVVRDVLNASSILETTSKRQERSKVIIRMLKDYPPFLLENWVFVGQWNQGSFRWSIDLTRSIVQSRKEQKRCKADRQEQS